VVTSLSTYVNPLKVYTGSNDDYAMKALDSLFEGGFALPSPLVTRETQLYKLSVRLK
jgi:hypothetical protein